MTQPRWSRAIRARLVLALLSALALVGAVTAPAPASASPTPAPILTVSAATDPALLSQLSDAPAESIPYVLTAVDVQFEVTVSLSAALSNDTTVTLTPNGTGVLSTTQATIAAGQTSVTVDETYSAVTPGLQISAVSSNKKIATGTTPAFPVDAALTVLGGQDAGLLGGTAGADGSGCTTVSPTNPICGRVTLPNGATGNVAMTLGPCPAGVSHCPSGNVVTQLIAGMSGIYSRTNPATMTLVCDKSLCGQGGVPHYTALWSEEATGDLLAAPACPSKGVIGDTQDFCTDYVASTRDNAGDLLLVVLFYKDVRGTI